MTTRQANPTHATRWRSVLSAVGRAVLPALFALLPLLLLLGSLHRPGQAPAGGFDWWPSPMTLDAHRRVTMFVTDWWAAMARSFLVVTIAVPVTVLIASMAGYAIVRSDPRWRRLLIGLSALGLLVPAALLWVPRFVLYRSIGVTDTVAAPMVPALMATTPIFVLLFALAYWRLPQDRFDLALLEGLSEWATWRRVALPGARHATIAVGLLAFVAFWGATLEPTLYAAAPGARTLPVVLGMLAHLDFAQQPVVLAAALQASIPGIVLLIAAQRALLVDTTKGLR